MRGQRASALMMALFVTISAVGLVAAVGADLSFSDDDAQPPDPAVNETTLTISHHMEDGSDDASLMDYRNDSGDKVSLPARVNDSIDNGIRITATHINDTDLQEFPRKSDEGDNGAAFHDASEWTTDGAAADNLSITNVDTAEGVEAIRLDTGSGMKFTGHAHVANATYSNFSITTDESKRFLTLFADIDTLDAKTHVQIRVYDEDGDYKTFFINQSKNANDAEVLANSTGDGKVTQTQLTDVTTNGSTFSNIENITFNITDGDLDGSFIIDLEKKSAYDLGTFKEDKDSDDALETTDWVEPTGEYRVYSLDTLDPAFNDAIIEDLVIKGVEYHAADLDQDEDDPELVNASFEDADQYPGFDKILDVYYRVEVPAAIDLSHSGLKLMHHTEWPSGRYALVEYKEGVSDDTNFSEISGWTAKTGDFDAQDKNVTIDDTVSTDNDMVIHYRLKLTQAEADAMQASGSDGGGAAAPPQQGGGGLLGFLSTPLGMVTSVAGVLGVFFRRRIVGFVTGG